MDNFEKSDIITDVAYRKNKSRFVPRDEQVRLNHQMKQKLVRFSSEIASETQRPEAMALFDEMMNGMHGDRVKNLYAYRRQGNHVMALICNSLPPELVYAMGNFIPVSVCMGAGEVEPYADEYSKGMCSVSRSLLGFLSSGMCVFFNLADHILSSDLCPSLKKTSDIIEKISDEFDVFCLQTNKARGGKLNVNTSGFMNWVNSINGGNGLNSKRLIEYASLYSEIRYTYQSIFNLRKLSNPPINGKNSLWIQQLMLVEEPRKLLRGLKTLEKELLERASENIGYDAEGKRKRVMLITPRIMPPFGEIYRVIENAGGIIVYEEIDMGITNINYELTRLNEILIKNGSESAAKYMLACVDINSSSCVKEFDMDKILHSIDEYNVDAVIHFSFRNCEIMHKKTNNINNLLNQRGIASLVIESDYMEFFEKELMLEEEISNFLYP
ncbi:2-hydroxyacyl-CoA dehydratase family protein [Marinilabilia rubra]|uniref:2-hydroxyacyl-CoA dehydratase n=1 Tax=Marinilabilia rubra TaxID=2162893 RepID=A0A2U2B7S4_9BACT|nr:2-hydroxyacyl-CoA dehydratase family protein [Marinilabilia rubra]PWD99105.1 2-hydroxyacyl-CoA dehydratase [Marinilabilia rubra]